MFLLSVTIRKIHSATNKNKKPANKKTDKTFRANLSHQNNDTVCGDRQSQTRQEGTLRKRKLYLVIFYF